MTRAVTNSRKKVPKADSKVPLQLTSRHQRTLPTHELATERAGRLWELLRRNPGFRTLAVELTRRPKAAQALLPREKKLAAIDGKNPLAGFCLRWFLRPTLFSFKFEFMRRWSLSDWLHSGYPFLGEESAQEWLEAADELDDQDTVTFDIEWAGAPELFRLQFAWMVSAYDPSPRIESEAGRYLTVGPVSDMDILALENLSKTHKFFAIPRLLFTSEDKKALRDRFEDLLDSMFFIDVRKHLYGGPQEWELFTHCYPNITYEGDPKGPRGFIRTGTGRALGKWIESRPQKGKWEAHAEKHWEKMESIMFATFPDFDFSKIIELSLGQTSDAAIKCLNEHLSLAKEDAAEKLCALKHWGRPGNSR